MVIKRKTAKKSAKKTSAKTAKTKVPTRGTREDPCQDERDARNRVAKEVDEIEASLSEPDIPADVREELEARLTQKRGRLGFLQRKLDECEAKHRRKR
jgi:hypothetical protein